MRYSSFAVLLLATVALTLSTSGKGQSSSPAEGYRCHIYKCYVEGSMGGWLSSLKAMENTYAKEKSDELLLEIVRTYYGYIAYALNQERKAEADSMLDRAFAYLDSYRHRHPNDAEATAIYSSLLGFRLAVHPTQALTLGLQSQHLIAKAMKQAPNNPWVMYEQANALLYTPAFFGGAPQQALRLYLRAIALLEKQGGNGCSWNYLNAYINLAYCQIKLKQYAAAQQTYSQLLAIAPTFKWVRQVLVPKLQQKMRNKR
ncbi:tetratricopeptide repeat protein [uncultured Acetobacteroides sp.]|uniref:tetratricopeptide repeat protein n=1 Tax=uncultured Acetobacteroides sp. TaxID=1760811 RepID=UPI0029F52452|nr:tetratricopeptide repeat protein [uncultured Acetobacteroides sp.]